MTAEKTGDRWGESLVTVTLTGDQWFALMARMVNRDLSPKGARIYNQAAEKLRDQILASSDTFKKLMKVST